MKLIQLHIHQGSPLLPIFRALTSSIHRHASVALGQKGVDGGSKWRAGTREPEVRLDGFCEGGLGQQRNDDGGCASIREKSERVESPVTE